MPQGDAMALVRIQFQETQQTPRRIKTENVTPEYNVVRMVKVKILKAASLEENIEYI